MDDCANMPPRSFVQIGERQMSYVDWGGAGPCVLLLHGIINCAYAWWQLAPLLAQVGYRVYGLDLPGHGASDLPADHRIDGIAAQVGATIEALDLHDLTLIGHSWGGATALALASGDQAARERLARVVLIDPAMAMSPAYGQQVLPHYLAAVGQAPELTAPNSRMANPPWHACDVYWRSVALAECRAAAVEGFFTGSGAWSLVERVGLVKVPLLVLLAEAGKTVVRPEVQARIDELLERRGQLVHVAATDHNMFYGAGCAPTLGALVGWLAEQEVRRLED